MVIFFITCQNTTQRVLTFILIQTSVLTMSIKMKKARDLNLNAETGSRAKKRVVFRRDNFYYNFSVE